MLAPVHPASAKRAATVRSPVACHSVWLYRCACLCAIFNFVPCLPQRVLLPVRLSALKMPLKDCSIALCCRLNQKLLVYENGFRYRHTYEPSSAFQRSLVLLPASPADGSNLKGFMVYLANNQPGKHEKVAVVVNTYDNSEAACLALASRTSVLPEQGIVLFYDEVLPP